MTSDLANALEANRRRLDRRAGERDALKRAVIGHTEAVAESQDKIERLEKAVAVLNAIGDSRQETIQRQIETIVTRGLRTIFADDLSFHMVSSTKSNATTIDFVVRTTLSDGTTIDTPVMDARGGGLASVVGFLLRVVHLLLSPSSVRRILVLDETFAAVSVEYETRLAEFISELVERTGVQILLVTHSTAFSDAASVVYSVSQSGHETVIA